MPQVSKGPYQIAELDIHLINEVFRQLEFEVNQISGLTDLGTVAVGPHTHVAGTTGSGGAIDASAVTYTPAVLGDWDGSLDPGDVDDALDQLADRVDDVDANDIFHQEAQLGEKTLDFIFAQDPVLLTFLAEGDAVEIGLRDTEFLDQAQLSERLTDQVFEGTGISFTEMADGSGDALLVAVDTSVVITTSNTDWIDLTDGGETTLHTHAGISSNTDQAFWPADLTSRSWETVTEGIQELGYGVDSSNRWHRLGQNRFRHLNSLVTALISTEQTGLAVNTWTSLQLDGTDEVDTDSLHDPASNNTRLTAKIAGKYGVFGTIRFDLAGATTPSGASARIIANGSTATVYGIQTDFITTTATTTVNVFGVVSLAVDEYVELQGIVTASSGTFTMGGGNTDNKNRFGMFYLGE